MACSQLTDLSTLTRHLLDTQGAKRRLVAIAGAPGSGKSTFAAALAQSLNSASTGSTRPLPTPAAPSGEAGPGPARARGASNGIAGVLGMDGFHLDDRVLIGRGQRERKGAPYTFDTGGLAATLARLRADDGSDIAVPVFDRDLEIARAGACILQGELRLIIVEGNYLLLDDPAWRPLWRHWDLTVSLEVRREVLLQRLTRRWQSLGLPPGQVQAKLEGNDLPNAELILSRSAKADFVVIDTTL